MSVLYAVACPKPGHNPLRDPRDRRLNRIAGASSLVLFGVTGDHARKMLMPAVYDLANRGLLPPSFALVGFGRRNWSNEDFAAEVKEAVKAYSRTPFDEAVWNQLSEGIRFVQGEFDDDEAFERLGDTIDELDEQRGTPDNMSTTASWDSASYRKLHADEIARLESLQDSFDQTKFSCPPSHPRHGLQAILDEGRLTSRRVAIVV